LYPIVGGDDPGPGATGAHEVAVLSPAHHLSFAQLDEAQATELLTVLRDRARHHLAAGRAFVQVVINHGAAAGASIAHPHAQLVALDFVPPAAEEAVRRARAAGRDLVVEDRERSGDALRVFDGAAPSWCPHAAGTPYEFRIALRVLGANFDDADDAQIAAVAQTARATLARLAAVVGDVPYNLVVHTAPPDTAPDAFHWYVEVQTRIAVIAGFEQGTGILVNTTPPELAAAQLGDGKKAGQRPTNFALPGPCSRKLRTPVTASSVRKTSANASVSRSRPSSSRTSSAPSITILATPMATTAPDANDPAHASAASSRWAAGATRPTRPRAAAWSAPTCRPLQMSSLARAGPISRGSRCVAPAPGITPSSVSGCPTRASSAAMRRSQASASSRPPPSATPLIAAMTGRGISPIASNAARKRPLMD